MPPDSDDPFLDDDPLLSAGDLPADSSVSSISALATELKAAEAEVMVATEALQRALNKYRRIADNELPAALRAAGTSELTTDAGVKVGLRVAYDSRQLTNPEGLKWVEENGGSSLIKTAVLVELDRGDLDAAREIIQMIRDSRHANKLRTLVLNESVHPQTLAGWVRRQIEEERKDPPLDKLGIYRRTYAILGGTRPKTVDLKGFRR